MKKRHQDKQRRQLLNQQQDQAKRIFFPRELPTAYDDYVYLRYERLLRARSLSKQSLWQGEMFRHYAVMLLWVLLASLVIAAKHVDWKVAPQSATAIPQSNTPSAPASPLRVNPPMQPTPAGESHLPVQSQTLGSSSHLRQSPLLNLSDQGMQSHPLDTAIQYLPLRSLNTVDSPTFFLSTAQK